MGNEKIERIKGKFAKREKTPEEIHLEDCHKQASIVDKMENKLKSLANSITKVDTTDKVKAEAEYKDKLKRLENAKASYGKEIASVTAQKDKEKTKYESMNCPKR